MTGMPLDWLNTLSVFAHSKDINEAAKILGISQPGVSFRLKCLEEAVGAPIFQTVRRKKMLTALGKELEQKIFPLLQQLNSTVSTTLSRRENRPEPIRVATRIENVSFLHTLFKKYEGSFSIEFLSTRQSLEKLRNFEIDLAVTTEKPDVIGLVSKHIRSDKMVIAHPSDWKIGNETDLLNKPCLAFALTENYWQRFLKVHKLKNISNLKLTCPDWLALQSFVNLGLGWSIVPERFVQNSTNLKFLNLPDHKDFRRELFILYHSSLRRNAKFTDILRSSQQLASPLE